MLRNNQLKNTRLHNQSHEEQLMNYMEYKLHKILLLYIPPFLLIIGTIGNVLSFCVLLRKAMRRTSTYNYLAVLSFTDMLVLYVGLLRLWVGELTGVDIRDESDWSCKIISMAGYTVSVYSVWLLIAVTVERYIVTVHSLRAPTMCTQGRAVKTIGLILLILLSVNLHFLWTTQIQSKKQQEPRCNGAEGYEQLVERIWPWIDACLYCILPFVIICILNCLIVHKVVLSRRMRRLLPGSSMSGSTNNNGGTGSGNNRSANNESSARVTIMLLTISFTFLVCTLPMNVTLVHRAILGFDTMSLKEVSQYQLSRTVSELLMYTNHSINFYLYLLTGQKFRQQLISMVCVCSNGKSKWCQTRYNQVHRDSNHQFQLRHSHNNRPPARCTELSVVRNGTYTKVVGK